MRRKRGKILARPDLGRDYYSVDFNPNFPGIRKVVDIRNIPFEDNFFAVVIANHIIEHIPDESLALREVMRVLKPAGTASYFLSEPSDGGQAATAP